MTGRGNEIMLIKGENCILWAKHKNSGFTIQTDHEDGLELPPINADLDQVETAAFALYQ